MYRLISSWSTIVLLARDINLAIAHINVRFELSEAKACSG